MPDREKVIKGLECCVSGNTAICERLGCPYADEHEGIGDTCIDTLMADALALLKAQEAESVDAPKPDSDIGCWYDITHNYTLEQIVSALNAQESRVMTVDEVREWVGKKRVDREPICVEVKDSICAWIVSDEYWDMQMDINLSGDLYGKTWRCWTSRPTDAQMEAIPWQAPSTSDSAPNG